MTTFTIKRKTFADTDDKKKGMSTGGKILTGAAAVAGTFALARRGGLGTSAMKATNSMWAKAGNAIGSKGMVASGAKGVGVATAKAAGENLATTAGKKAAINAANEFKQALPAVKA